MEESHEMSEEVRQKLIDLYAKGIMTDEIIMSIIKNVEKNHTVNKRALKKMVKKNGIPSPPSETASPSHEPVSIISYQLSRQIWLGMMVKLNFIQKSVTLKDPAFKGEEFIFNFALLNGFSLSLQAGKFPEEIKIGKYSKSAWLKKTAMPGDYLISWHDKTNGQSWPHEACIWLDINLLVEAIIVLKKSSRNYPRGYFQTNTKNGHGEEIYVLVDDHEITFMEEKQVPPQATVYECLTKYEDWMV